MGKFFRNPFRLRFWLFHDDWDNSLCVKRQRFSWNLNARFMLTDGPFDTNEDAARALHFWKAQTEDIIGNDDLFCDEFDTDDDYNEDGSGELK